ncbi:MAG: thiamine biosynthesis protein ThiS [Rhodospirillaceae bacterium]|nr:thiamine biosynthesis protein ThiS [Rhodospirillaceae bacterium]|tara:strand:+ start:785 stop:979 length:195 start_codon:yes stop_codon:yes gene_type:complete
MNITVNGKLHKVTACNLADLLLQLKYSGKVATALNENFVAAHDRDKTELRDGDRVEIVTPMEGG